MTLRRKSSYILYGIAAALLALSGAASLAQETEETEETAADEETIEEIIVVAPRPGSRRRVDQEYEDPARAKLLKDFYKLQEEREEYEWRKAAAEESDSRVAWGYDPAEEYQMRNQMDLTELPTERTKPASLFRFNF